MERRNANEKIRRIEFVFGNCDSVTVLQDRIGDNNKGIMPGADNGNKSVPGLM